VTKSVVANDSSGKKREEVFVDIIEKISVTFNASVSVGFTPESVLTSLPCAALVTSHLQIIHDQSCCMTMPLN
jgi:hypothetical protein